MQSELRYSTQQIDESDIECVKVAMTSPWLTQGPIVDLFEEALAEYVGAKYAVAVNSGTAALHVALEAIALPSNSWVFTSPLSFVATANAITMAGLVPRFRDVDEDSGIVPVDNFASKDYAFVPVHYAGRAAPIPTDTKVVEDACHALGAMDFDGCSKVGSCAHSLATCFSFHAVKPITTGEGGAVTTNDQGLRDVMRLMRSHGRGADGLMTRLGWNYRMTEIAAALGLSQLRRCDAMRERRVELSRMYRRLLTEWLDGAGLPYYEPDTRFKAERSAFHLYTTRVKDGRRDQVKQRLWEQGIVAQVHYSPIIPLHPYYWSKTQETHWPNAQAWADEELSLPLHAGMKNEDVQRVVEALKEAIA